jgi:NTP pyrophosphatase (non-canonical NTP hydrolase)
MKELQTFMRDYQKEMGWEIDSDNYANSRESLLNNYMLLTTEVAEVAEELRRTFNQTQQNILDGREQEEAFLMAKENAKENIGKELADCMAYLIKFYNFFEIDIEDSFYNKMREVKYRKNKDL